jgi:hypothetical protein
MSILTKPSFTKGVASSVSLSKSELSALSVVSSDSYFSNQVNWAEILVFYKSTVGKQLKVLKFDPSQSSPSTSVLFSVKARNNFELQKIIIMDYDSGTLSISRSDLTAAGINVASVFDISFGGGAGPTAYQYYKLRITSAFANAGNNNAP